MVEFDFRQERSKIFGPIFRPVAHVVFRYGDTVFPEIVYVDSGADFTIIPKQMGDFLQLPAPTSSEIYEVRGLSEHHIPIVIRKVFVQIGEREFHPRVAWSLIEEVPTLLGRLDLFEFFDLIFKRGHTTQFIW